MDPASRRHGTRRRNPSNRRRRNYEKDQDLSQRAPSPITFADAVHELILDKSEATEECQHCLSPIDYIAITSCSRSNCPSRICWVCGVRTRLLANSKRTTPHDPNQPPIYSCQICQNFSQELVLTARKDLTWAEIEPELDQYTSMPELNIGLYFGDKHIEAAFRKIIKQACWFPECRDADLSFDSFQGLTDHLRRVHNRVYCDVCYEYRHAYLFPAEHILYDPSDLPRHRREGDQSSSYGCIKPHVFCRVCRKYYFDSDEYEAHWRPAENHFECRLCKFTGDPRTLFGSIAETQAHYEAAHFPCPVELCIASDVCFSDNDQLQLHMAREHLKGSDFYQHIGRRGVQVNFNAMSPTPQQSSGRQNQRRKRVQPSYETTCSHIPPSMVAEMPSLLHHFKELHEQNVQESTTSKTMQEKLTREREQRWAMVPLAQWNEATAIFRTLKEPGATADSVLTVINKLSLSVYKMQDFESPPKSDDSPSTSGSPPRLFPDISAVCELLLIYLTACPPDWPGRVFIQSALTDIAGFATEGRGLVKKQELGLAKRVDELQDESPDLDHVLGRCDFLPLNKAVSFAEAVDWALKEYTRLTENNKPSIPSDEVTPNRVPKLIIARLKGLYSRSALETFEHLTRDLGDYIPTMSLDRFLGLRATYMRLRGSREPLSDTGREDREHRLKWMEAVTRCTREWGTACDHVFKDMKPVQLVLLRHYVRETINAIPSAVVDPNGLLRSGVERSPIVTSSAVRKNFSAAVINSGTGAVEVSEDFPALVTPQAASGSSWVRLAGSASGQARSAAAASSSSRPRRVVCRGCGFSNRPGATSCNGCPRSLVDQPEVFEEFPRLTTQNIPALAERGRDVASRLPATVHGIPISYAQSKKKKR